MADGNEGEMAGGFVDLRANTPTNYSIDVVIPSDFESTVSLKFGWGKTSGDDIEDNGSVTVQVKDVSFKTTTSIPDPDATTTPGPTTTTAKPTTTPTTTTAKPTTTSLPSTTPVTVKPSTLPTTKAPVTVAPTKKSSGNNNRKTTSKKNTVVNKISKAKIKKVVRKKKSLKLKLKKIKGANGYQIKYSDVKNFDGYWTKRTSKTKVTLKKLDRKTKYYLKVRAYKKVGSVYQYGKYSKRKKVKTK